MIFSNIFFSVLVAKNDQIKVFSSLIFHHKCFLTILVIVTQHLYCRKILRDCFHFICLATSFYYEKVRRTMRTAIVSYVLNTYVLFLILSCVCCTLGSSVTRLVNFAESGPLISENSPLNYWSTPWIQNVNETFWMSFEVFMYVQLNVFCSGVEVYEHLWVFFCFWYKSSYSNWQELLPSQHLLVQGQQWKRQKFLLNFFKVNNRGTKATSSKSFWCPNS